MTHTNDVPGFHPQQVGCREAHLIINDPSFEVEDVFG